MNSNGLASGYASPAVAAALGTATVDFTGGATGAVARTPLSKGGERLSVRDFGAVGDGVTDDSQAVANCMAEAIKRFRLNSYAPWRNNQFNRFGSVAVHFPAGTYRIVNPAVLDTSAAAVITNGLVFRGDGPVSEVFFDPSEASESRTIVAVADAHTVQLDAGASAADGFYVGCRFFTTAKGSANNANSAVCIAYTGSTRTAVFGTDFSPTLTTSNTFTVYGVPQTGALSAATSTTLSFAASDPFVSGATANSLKGRRVRLVSGTGSGQECVIASNAAPSGGLVVATLGRTLATIPDGTTGYWAQGSVLLMNTRYTNLRFERMTFLTGAARCLWYWSDRSSSFAVQRMTCRDVEWTGFSKGLELDASGANNNDQHAFTNCKVYNGIVECFLHLLDTDQEIGFDFDQFFYFGSWGPIVRADKGGNIHCRNVDAANWARNVTSDAYLFELNNNNAQAGMQSLAVLGLRSEVINSGGHSKILKCLWKSGALNFQNVDLESQAFAYSFNQTMFYFNIGNQPGPQTTWRNCKLVGKIEVEFNTSGTTQEGAFSFDDCGWYDVTTWIPVTPEEVVTYTKTGAHSNKGAAPAVRFRNCRKISGRTGNARYVWDYVVGWSTQRYARHAEGVVTVAEYAFGEPASGGTVNTTYFPIGAVVTGFSLWAPAQADGGSSETNSATYILKTEAGTEICRTTIADPHLGFYVTVPPTAGWWHCKDDASRRLVLTPDTDVATGNVGLAPMIRYLGAS